MPDEELTNVTHPRFLSQHDTCPCGEIIATYQDTRRPLYRLKVCAKCTAREWSKRTAYRRLH